MITTLEECCSHLFLIIVLLIFLDLRNVTSDSSKGATVTIALPIVFIIIIKSIILVYYLSLVVLVPGRSQVITLREL